jgi:bacillithiol biosynthesis cysteine-adding enzyme BshC
MKHKAEFISYQQTGYFSKIVTDYLSQNNLLQPFYQHTSNIEGIKASIAKRNKFNTNRQILVEQLQLQYAAVHTSEVVANNIQALSSDNTFTICTAHQPNIFTGHLYFIYKIIHTIKVADTLNKELPENKFVPVFYMGSEDADIKELGEVTVNGKKYQWHTKQTGAVGRMSVDDELINILKSISAQISVESYGTEIIELVKKYYSKGSSIQDACFGLINELFSDKGLVVLLPDNAELKKQMLTVFEEDIFVNTPSEIVNKTSAELEKNYKVQAYPREINLFYLKDTIRNRIIEEKNIFRVNDTSIKFTKEELQAELDEHPERFSPNVILRALYQETILPNIAFIGGGGELAYWLELKDLFQHYKVPYPVLILRNSFLFINHKLDLLTKKFSLTPKELFTSEDELINEIVQNNTLHQLSLEAQKKQINLIYDEINGVVNKIDLTLEKHAKALQVRSLKLLDNLEAKMFRAEKKRFEAQQRQIKKIKENLFPANGLQERVDNFVPFYAKWNKEFIEVLYSNSLVFEQQFCIITEENKPTSLRGGGTTTK